MRNSRRGSRHSKARRQPQCSAGQCNHNLCIFRPPGRRCGPRGGRARGPFRCVFFACRFQRRDLTRATTASKSTSLRDGRQHGRPLAAGPAPTAAVRPAATAMSAGPQSPPRLSPRDGRRSPVAVQRWVDPSEADGSARRRESSGGTARRHLARRAGGEASRGAAARSGRAAQRARRRGCCGCCSTARGRCCCSASRRATRRRRRAWASRRASRMSTRPRPTTRRAARRRRRSGRPSAARPPGCGGRRARSAEAATVAPTWRPV